MSAGARLSAQIGKIKESLILLRIVINDLGAGAATYAVVDPGDREILMQLSRELAYMAEDLEDKARESIF